MLNHILDAMCPIKHKGNDPWLHGILFQIIFRTFDRGSTEFAFEWETRVYLRLVSLCFRDQVGAI